jgi:transposase
MKYVTQLSEIEVSTLTSMYKYHSSSQVRSRAHGILLSHRRFRLQEISKILFLTRQSVSSLFDQWETCGLAGLYDQPRNGRPPALNEEEETLVKDSIQKEPRSIKRVLAMLADQSHKWISKSTLSRLLKGERLRWKRVRKSLRSKRDEQRFRQAQQRITQLTARQQEGEINLVYFDEAGFSLDPYVPYAWQPEGENIEIPAAKSDRLNLLGFMNTHNDLTPFIFKGSINTEIVIACFDAFSQNLNKKTVVLIDNASIHKSAAFKSQIGKWYQRGLLLRFLPPYSPELNLIEILWRKIKYEWMSFSAYLSLKHLENELINILGNFGSQYVINFKVAKC